MAKRNKTNKSVKKRMKATGGGQIKHGTPGKRHLNAHLTPKRRRQLRLGQGPHVRGRGDAREELRHELRSTA